MASVPAQARSFQFPRMTWSLLALALLLLFNFFFTDGFFRFEVRDGALYGSVVDIVVNGTPVLLAALGMTLVIATGGVDLSVGAVLAISGALAAVILTSEIAVGNGALVALAIIVPIAVATLAGAFNGGLVAAFGVQPIVVTLVLMVAGRGVAMSLTEGQIMVFENDQFAYLGGGHFLGLPVRFWIVLLMFVGVGLVVRLSALGLFIEAVGGNESASRIAGLRAPLLKMMVYAFSGFCAGVAGLIEAADIRAADANTAGLYLELDAILAVVVGGTALVGGRFSLLGTLVGALLIQTLHTSILSQDLPIAMTYVVKALVVIAVCLLQSEVWRQWLATRRRRA